MSFYHSWTYGMIDSSLEAVAEREWHSFCNAARTLAEKAAREAGLPVLEADQAGQAAYWKAKLCR